MPGALLWPLELGSGGDCPVPLPATLLPADILACSQQCFKKTDTNTALMSDWFQWDRANYYNSTSPFQKRATGSLDSSLCTIPEKRNNVNQQNPTAGCAVPIIVGSSQTCLHQILNRHVPHFVLEGPKFPGWQPGNGGGKAVCS